MLSKGALFDRRVAVVGARGASGGKGAASGGGCIGVAGLGVWVVLRGGLVRLGQRRRAALLAGAVWRFRG